MLVIVEGLPVRLLAVEQLYWVGWGCRDSLEISTQLIVKVAPGLDEPWLQIVVPYLGYVLGYDYE